MNMHLEFLHDLQFHTHHYLSPSTNSTVGLFTAAKTFLCDVFFLAAAVVFVVVVFFTAVDLDLPAFVAVVGGIGLAAGWLDNMKLQNGSGCFSSILLCDD
jgi:hypothetical protein